MKPNVSPSLKFPKFPFFSTPKYSHFQTAFQFLEKTTAIVSSLSITSDLAIYRPWKPTLRARMGLPLRDQSSSCKLILM